jgi:hypothetical protein
MQKKGKAVCGFPFLYFDPTWPLLALGTGSLPELLKACGSARPSIKKNQSLSAIFATGTYEETANAGQCCFLS